MVFRNEYNNFLYIHKLFDNFYIIIFALSRFTSFDVEELHKCKWKIIKEMTAVYLLLRTTLCYSICLRVPVSSNVFYELSLNRGNQQIYFCKKI